MFFKCQINAVLAFLFLKIQYDLTLHIFLGHLKFVPWEYSITCSGSQNQTTLKDRTYSNGFFLNSNFANEVHYGLSIACFAHLSVFQLDRIWFILNFQYGKCNKTLQRFVRTLRKRHFWLVSMYF